MVDRPEFDRWRKEAGQALRGAQAQAAAGVHNWACFSAEQAAQLVGKALLHGLGEGPRGHDLMDLGQKAEDAAADAWELDVRRELQALSQLYIPTRYPDAHAGGPPGDHYSDADSGRAIAMAAAVIEAVDAAWAKLQA